MRLDQPTSCSPRAPGSQLFLLFNHAGTGHRPARRGHGYALKPAAHASRRSPGSTSPTLFEPARAGREPRATCSCSTRATPALARDPATARSSTSRVYWRVRAVRACSAGDTLSTFTDTSHRVRARRRRGRAGAVSTSSGSAIVLISDPQDPRIQTRVFQFARHIATSRSPRGPAAIRYTCRARQLASAIRPGIVEEGSGIGTLADPRGLYSGAGPARGHARAATPPISARTGCRSSPTTLSSTGLLPDRRGFVGHHVQRAGGRRGRRPRELHLPRPTPATRRVLRYDPYGQFVQRVDVEKDSDRRPLVVTRSRSPRTTRWSTSATGDRQGDPLQEAPSEPRASCSASWRWVCALAGPRPGALAMPTIAARGVSSATPTAHHRRAGRLDPLPRAGHRQQPDGHDGHELRLHRQQLRVALAVDGVSARHRLRAHRARRPVDRCARHRRLGRLHRAS